MNRTLLWLALGGLLLAGCREQPKVSSAPPVNLSAELARARAGNKLLVLEFTGSDWCPSCIVFHKEVLSQPEFQAYAQSNLVWIEIDFPKGTALPPATEATNKALASRFGIDPLPAFVALNHEGKEIWRLPAKDDPAPVLTLKPQVFIDQLETVRKKQG